MQESRLDDTFDYGSIQTKG